MGQGSFGAVYSAIDLILECEKAVKIMTADNPQHAHKLFEEAAIPYKCKHNNIVQINSGSLEPYNGEIHFVIDMELVNGGSLEDSISKQFLSVQETVQIMKGVLFALQHSHQQGIVHRDIKPANILLNNGEPKLTDFGLATALNQELPRNEKWYMTHVAPEIKKTLTPTVKTDIFAVGVTMFRAINNIDDWENYLIKTPKIDVLYEKGTFIEKGTFQPYVPKKVMNIIKKSCKVDPLKRYSSAADMRDALEKLIPIIDWRKENAFLWIGESKQYKRSIQITESRKKFKVDIKTNGRRNIELCKLFESAREAEGYMYSHIATTTYK